MTAAVPSMTLDSPPPSPVEVPVAKFTTPPQASRHITLGFYYVPRGPAYRESCESGHKPPRLAVPFLPLYSVWVMPFISTPLPSHSPALSLDLCSSFLILTPFYGCLPCQPRSPPITAPLILRAGVSGG